MQSHLFSILPHRFIFPLNILQLYLFIFSTFPVTSGKSSQVFPVPTVAGQRAFNGDWFIDFSVFDVPISLLIKRQML